MKYPASEPHTQNHQQPLAYGNWPSAISAQLVVADSVSLDEPKLTAEAVYYLERRPQEKGRCVIVRVSLNDADKSRCKMSDTNNCDTAHLNRIDILPEPYSARSRVHEYGGGCYCLSNNDNGAVFFVNDADQDIYCIADSQICRITHEPDRRFSDLSYDRTRNQLIAVCETHSNNTISNFICRINIDNGEVAVLVQGDDFYASPRLNTKADRLCWQAWNHPNMPWDGNQLWLATLDEQGDIECHRPIAGGEEVSTFQPQWSPDGILYFISDDTGWWHLYRYLDAESPTRVEQLTEGEKEFGLPQWVFAQSNYAFLDNTTIICCYRAAGRSLLATLSLSSPTTLTRIYTPWQEYHALASTLNTVTNNACFITASDRCFPQLVAVTLYDTEKKATSHVIKDHCIIKTSCQLPVADNNYSRLQYLEFNNQQGQKVYANYYPPTNPDYCGETDERPPLIVICHGGPTGQASTALDPKKQFWTSRGFALLDVNYSGSTGYGRNYRERLINQWGQLDVEDYCTAALYAVTQGMADEKRLIIRGSSAGGYTVLSALTYQQVFSAGASYYGISELSSLATDTHKFESHYLDRLIGPYPQASERYRQRSPIYHSEQLNCPVIFFQGVEDRVVPKEQAEKMFAALDRKGLPVAAQYFAEEQHGFRKAETIVQSLENELNFYRLVFQLQAKTEIEFTGDIQIKNI